MKPIASISTNPLALTLLARLHPLCGRLSPDGWLTLAEEAGPHPLRGTRPGPALSLPMLAHPHDRVALDRALDILRNGQSITGLVLRLIPPEGEPGIFALHAEPDPEGGPALALLEDQTEARRRQAQLARLASVAERTSNQVILCDADWRIVWVNPAFTRRTGYDATEARGKRPSVLLRADISPRLEALEQETLDAGEPFRCELQVLARNGEAFWIEILVERLTDTAGAPFGYSVIGVDISERRAQMQRMAGLEAETRRARLQLSEALEALPFGFVLYDQNDKLVLCNAVYRRIYARSTPIIRPGVRFEDILRYGLEQGQYPEAEGREEEWLDERLKVHRSGRSDIEQRLPDGQWLRVFETMTPEGGRVGLRIDITALKSAEAALQDSRDRLNAILHAAPDGIMTVDRQMRIREFNPGAEALFGYEKADVLDQSIDMLIMPEDRARHGGFAAQFFDASSGAGRWMQPGRVVSARHATGRTFPLLVSLSLAVIGGESMVVAVMTDMTAQEAQRQALEDKTRQIADQLVAVEEANRAKSRFLAAMSHELRSPLNAIIGFSEFLATHGDDRGVQPRRVEYLNDIRSAGLHLLSLINDLLDLARIEDRGASLDLAPHDPDRLLEDPLRLMRPILQKKNHRIETDVQSGLPQVLADARGVSQILINLLSNATKFSDAGARIGVVMRAEGDQVHILVEDVGCGIPADVMPRLGRPFEQVGSHWSGSSSGLGLGLAISRKLAEEMGGALTIESEEGAWTRVGFTLRAVSSLPNAV